MNNGGPQWWPKNGQKAAQGTSQVVKGPFLIAISWPMTRIVAQSDLRSGAGEATAALSTNAADWDLIKTNDVGYM